MTKQREALRRLPTARRVPGGFLLMSKRPYAAAEAK